MFILCVIHTCISYCSNICMYYSNVLYMCTAVLLQMSDVTLGGATVFPNVGARIPPGNVSQIKFWCCIHTII